METSLGLEPTSLPLGTEVGPWRVVGLGARGRYGIIYRVERTEHPEAGLFALKLALSPMDPRFEREGELLEAVLTDFGSCHYLGASTLTHQLPLPGTPQYASPESQRFQWRWRRQASARYEASPADDLYALGMTAYRLVTGRYPPDPTEAEVSETADDAGLILPPLVPPETSVHLSPELARLIRQLLSEDPAARGSPAEVVYALEHAVRTTGRLADQSITPITSGTSPAHEEEPVPEHRSPSRYPWLMAAAASVALAASIWAVTSSLTREPRGAVAEAAPPVWSEDGRDAGTVELGETALTERVGTAEPGPVRGGISHDMPKEPLPGQRRPPCEPPEVEVNDGCWWDLRNATPPCGKRAYAWKSRCYSPSFGPPRPATSGQQ